MSTQSPIVADIESRIDIVDLIREYVPLKKSGANWKGISPFKAEKTPSFVVSPAKQIAYCFATNQGGGPLRMLMLLEKIEFREALQILAKRAGVELKTDTVADQKSDERATLMKIYAEVGAYYAKTLWSGDGLEARQYILARGLTEETLHAWQIGYSHDPRDMYDHLRKRGFSEKALLDSGIFVSAFRDRFFGRLIFPICNYRGDIIAFSGRTLKSGGDEAKYVNSPETPIFHKSNVLFGVHHAKQPISKEKKVIVVEGQMDVISLHQAGITNAVGISGTAFTTEHLALIRRLTDQIYLCMDRDQAGILSILRSIENLAPEPVDVYVVGLGDAKDPDEFLRSGGDFRSMLGQSLSAIEFVIESGGVKYDLATNQGKEALLREVIQMILLMRSAVSIDDALRLVAKKLDLRLQTVYSEYNRAVRGRQAVHKPESTGSSSPSVNELLCAYIAGLNEGYNFFMTHTRFAQEILIDPDFADISHLVRGDIDPEVRQVYELRFESLSEDKKHDVVVGDFRSLLKNLDQTFFHKLKKAAAGDIHKLRDILSRGREYGLN